LKIYFQLNKMENVISGHLINWKYFNLLVEIYFTIDNSMDSYINENEIVINGKKRRRHLFYKRWIRL